MSLHRLRAHVRLGGGLATWARDQMAVRHGQAVHINEGLANEEPKRNEVVDTNLFICDLPLMNESHAIDAYNTLTAESVLAWVVAPGEEESWYIERHTCHHEGGPGLLRQPCVTAERWPS